MDHHVQRRFNPKITKFSKHAGVTAAFIMLTFWSHHSRAISDEAPTLSSEHQGEIGLLGKEGLDEQRENYRPTRELYLTTRGKMSRESLSLHWQFKWSGNRNLENRHPEKRLTDEIYYDQRRHLINGSILDQNQQFLVREAYFQWLEEGWLLQAGSIRYPWGSADFINPISVINSKDLRYGFTTDKDQQLLSSPSLRLSRLLDERSLTFVYVPIHESSLVPSSEHNWHLDLDNQRFRTRTIQDQKAREMGSVALKYDFTIPSGDLSVLYYNGADNDVIAQPDQLTVDNNHPLVLEFKQKSIRKNAWGGSYQQSFDSLVTKFEALYTPDKAGPKSFERADVESMSFPIELTTSPYIASTAGFNYFFKFRDLLGIKLSETIFTSEFYSQKYLNAGILPGLTSQMLLFNLRTGALEDRLEILATYIQDTVLDGHAKILKMSFSDDQWKHILHFGQFSGEKPLRDDIGSLFYYFRTRDYAAYEISYSI